MDEPEDVRLELSGPRQAPRVIPCDLERGPDSSDGVAVWVAIPREPIPLACDIPYGSNLTLRAAVIPARTKVILRYYHGDHPCQA